MTRKKILIQVVIFVVNIQVQELCKFSVSAWVDSGSKKGLREDQVKAEGWVKDVPIFNLWNFFVEFAVEASDGVALYLNI